MLWRRRKHLPKTGPRPSWGGAAVLAAAAALRLAGGYFYVDWFEGGSLLLSLLGLTVLAGGWPAAQARLHELVTTDKLNPEYLSVYVAALLRHGERDAARPWAERLDGLEPGSARVKDFRAALSAAPRP